MFGCEKQSVDGPVLIKFPHVTAPATPKGQAAERFKHVVEERLKGRVKVEVYPAGQLMSDDDSLDGLAFGEVQMIAIPVSKLDRLTNKFQVFDLPFLFPDLQAVERFQASDNGQALLTSIVDRKLLGLSFWHNGMKQFGGPVPMRTPQAAKGLKFRVMESDVLQAQILQIGGNPQKMAFGEVYQALQTGAVDAQENTWSNIYSSKFYEVQSYVTETNHGYIGYMVTVNPDYWNSLPDDIRVELDTIVAEVSTWANEQSAGINLAGKEKIIASGKTEVIELTAEERAVWQQAMRPVWDEFSDIIGAEAIAAAEAIGRSAD
ncbi:MAG: DctP family TRAP transporter solute-binding subunit [Proteobacteria bacterium]|nr:DctP family TRAP transporter solute-binding subunit [Pseudomonadota bacterium]